MSARDLALKVNRIPQKGTLSSFQARRGDPFGELFLRHQIDQQDGQDGDDRPGHLQVYVRSGFF